MINRRLKFIKRLEDWILEKNPSWKDVLTFEQPPLLEGKQSFDLAIPCFPMAKLERQSPAKIAQNLLTNLQNQQKGLNIQLLEQINAYVNIRFKEKVLAEALIERRGQPLKGSEKAFANEKLVVDFSSPNIAKPFGIGHLRSTNIGAAICRIYQALGAEVIRINHLGDWGTQFGKLIVAYKKFGSADFVKGDPINNLYKLYVEFHQREKDDPALLDEAREWFVKLEEGDEEARELWAWFRDVSYHEFKKIYERLGVEFDYVTGESFYNELMQETLERLEAKNLLKESEGAMVVDLEPYGMPPCLIKKSDGSTLYATRDLATAEYRATTFEPTQLVYVVGSEQKLHFRQVFKVLELMGYEWAKNYKHVDFGLIKFPEGKMSTRKGNIILLEDVLNQAAEQALEILEEKQLERDEEKKLSEEEKIKVSELVGMGAVIFFDLKAKRTKDVMFDWNEILNFEGDSGPYLQYTCVRLKALLEKARALSYEASASDLPQLSTEMERELARSLLVFPVLVESAAREYEPSVISHSLLDLAAVFNRFYMNVPILKGEESQRLGRLQLVQLTLEAMECGLNLLGIRCPERM